MLKSLLIGIFLVGLLIYGGWFLYGRSLSLNQENLWQPYNSQRLQEAVKEGRPVVIDFFAQWCWACHELDQNVFSNPEIRNSLSRYVLLRVDATSFDDPIVSKIVEQYHVVGLPTVIFLDKKGREIEQARVEGVVSIKKFNKSLQISSK